LKGLILPRVETSRRGKGMYRDTSKGRAAQRSLGPGFSEKSFRNGAHRRKQGKIPPPLNEPSEEKPTRERNVTGGAV